VSEHRPVGNGNLHFASQPRYLQHVEAQGSTTPALQCSMGSLRTDFLISAAAMVLIALWANSCRGRLVRTV